MNDVIESELARKQYEQYVNDRDRGHADYVIKAKQYNAYYLGDQWDEADRRALEKQGRPALTINEVLPTINAVIGEYTLKRADFLYKPAKGGTAPVAEALTKVAQHVGTVCKYDYKEGLAFADGVISERGWLDLRIDFSQNLLGEIAITVDDPSDVIPDPDAKEYDPKTWNRVTSTRWMSLDDIAVLYGQEKADKLKYLGVSDAVHGSDSVEFRATYGDPDAAGDAGPDFTEARLATARLRVIEKQQKRLTMQKFFVDKATGEMKQVPDQWTAAKVDEFTRRFGLGVHKKLTQRIRWTCTCDSVVLHDAWSPYRSFTKIPYFPYFRRGQPMGVVRNLISPQDQLNKVSSQELHVVNTTANSGWQMEEGSLVNMDENELEQRGAETGLVLVRKRGTEPLQKIVPNTIPTGLDRISAKASGNIRRISGVTDSMLGLDKADVSGVAIERKQNRGLIQMEVPFDNLNMTRNLVGDKLLELIQDFYTEERMFQITNFGDPSHPTEELAINQLTPEGVIANDITVGEYAVVVASAPARDTFDESQFAEAISLRQIGVMIPDDFIIQYSHLSKKGELVEQVRQLNGTAPMSEEQAQQEAMLQQIQMRQILAELASVDAQTEELQSRTALNLAKAQQLGAGDPESGESDGSAERAAAQQAMVDLQAQREKLEADRRNLLTQLDVQLRIASDATAQRREAAQLSAQTARAKMRHDSFDRRLDTEARMKEKASRPAPAAKSGR